VAWRHALAQKLAAKLAAKSAAKLAAFSAAFYYRLDGLLGPPLRKLMFL